MAPQHSHVPFHIVIPPWCLLTGQVTHTGQHSVQTTTLAGTWCLLAAQATPHQPRGCGVVGVLTTFTELTLLASSHLNRQQLGVWPSNELSSTEIHDRTNTTEGTSK